METYEKLCVKQLKELLYTTTKKLFDDPVDLRDIDDQNENLEGALLGIMRCWIHQVKDFPAKNNNSNTQYKARLLSWFNGRDTNALVKLNNKVVLCKINNIIMEDSTSATLGLQFEDKYIEVQGIDIRTIMPIFQNYCSLNYYNIIAVLQEYSKEVKTNNQITPNKEEKEMTKLNKAVENVSNNLKNSTSLAAGIAAGNATNAVVKAALRPVLEPILRKALEPKGLIQRTLGKSKVEDSVSAIMDSVLMDILSATILVGITSSGLVTNDKLVKGASFASDAAMIKLANMVDFDALVSGVADKVSSIVSSLETKEAE